MEVAKWLAHYREIVKRLDLSWEDDQKAADILSNLIKGNISLRQLESTIINRPVIVFGAGPSLTTDLTQLGNTSILEKCCLISADGATTALMKIGQKRPDVIVTDLDGKLEYQIEASSLGSIAVIHAHGDNIPRLRLYTHRFNKKIGSTQVKPRPAVYNFGGFTDGDRAVFLAIHFGARLVVLAGMDFGDKVGEYSKPQPYSHKAKLEKLRIGLELLEWLALTVSIPLYNMTNRGTEIRSFERIDLGELQRQI